MQSNMKDKYHTIIYLTDNIQANMAFPHLEMQAEVILTSVGILDNIGFSLKAIAFICHHRLRKKNK